MARHKSRRGSILVLRTGAVSPTVSNIFSDFPFPRHDLLSPAGPDIRIGRLSLEAVDIWKVAEFVGDTGAPGSPLCHQADPVWIGRVDRMRLYIG